MWFLEIIRQLKMGPTPLKAARALSVLGGLSLFAGLWNFVFTFFSLNDGFITPAGYPFIALFAGLFISGMFFISRRGVIEGQGWGRELGQTALVLFYVAGMSAMIAGPQLENPSPPAFLVLFGIMTGVPTLAGLVYLQRLTFESAAAGRLATAPEPRQKYAEWAPLQLQAFIYLFFLLSVIASLAQIPNTPRVLLLIFGGVLMIFAGMAALNFAPSSFQRENHLLVSRVGGLRTMLGHSPSPLTRMLVYGEGVEVRHFSRRYFIPYEKMRPPEIGGIFSTRISIDSELPGVPINLTFSSLDLDPISEAVRQAYARRLNLPPPPPRK